VPAKHADLANVDVPIPIPHEQVPTQPSLVAHVVEALALEGDERVLEIGTGYGWQTALLARLTQFVGGWRKPSSNANLAATLSAMRQPTRVERTIEHVVLLRRAGPAVADPRERRRLKQVERELQREIGVGVPKRRAAAVLGVSVTALDKWITRGRLPVVRRPGSSREQIDAEALLDLAEEVTRAREEGQTRSLLATAFERLAKRGRPRPKLRPNQPAHELRGHYLRTTPDDRVREVADLSRVLTELAARGAAARKADA